MTRRLSENCATAFLLTTFGLRSAVAQEEVNPWPTWGRTTTRLGSAQTVGPMTPRIEWSVQVDFWVGESSIYCSSSMDAYGRIFQGQLRGVTAVDSIANKVLWSADGGDLVDSSPAVFGDRVFWGVTALNSPLICSNAQGGEEIWRFDAEWGFRVSPTLDPTGVIYVNDQKANIYARRSGDGAEEWTVMINGDCFCPLALDAQQVLLGGRNFDVMALRPLKGSLPWEIDWVFHTSREVFGLVVVTEDVVYIASGDKYLYAVDRSSGAQRWRFYCEQANRGSIALGHNGIVYTATAGNVGWLFAVAADGQEIWRFGTRGLVLNSPVVGGDGTIYVCSYQGVPTRVGWVQAVRQDGTEKWTATMPDLTSASPMLAPDGTLYVMCRDKYLYAFRDPAGDLNYDQRIDLDDYARFPYCQTDPRLWGTKSNTIPGCELLDFDRDWDVDLADYAAFQNAFGTPVP